MTDQDMRAEDRCKVRINYFQNTLEYEGPEACANIAIDFFLDVCGLRPSPPPPPDRIFTGVHHRVNRALNMILSGGDLSDVARLSGVSRPYLRKMARRFDIVPAGEFKGHLQENPHG